MRKTLAGIVIGLALLGFVAAKQYSIPVGLVNSCDWTRILIQKNGNDIKADLYWNLYDANGSMLAENQKTTCSQTFTNAPTPANLKAFVNVTLTQEFITDAANFSGN